jgi:flagellar hook-associated protein 3 FlgL
VGLDQTTKQFDATNIGHGELGGRSSTFETAYDKLLAKETNYNILLQETGGADLAKLSMESKALEMTYQSLYSTIAKMNEMSLLNYIK